MSADDRTLDAMVRTLCRRTALSPGDQDAIRTLPYRRQTLEASAYLAREGDRPEYCVALLSGYAFRHKITGSGGRQILSLHIAGDLVDLHNSMLKRADHNTQMMTRGEVAYIPRRAIEEIAGRHSQIGRAMWVETLVDGSIFREWIANVGRRDARTRIAHLLCEFATRLEAAGLSRDGVFERPMTQEQLADATGLTSVHVNRMLRSLRTDGLISSSQRSVTIIDWPGLRAAGDFGADYLHLPPVDEMVGTG